MIAASSRVGFAAKVSDELVTKAPFDSIESKQGRSGYYSGVCRSAKPATAFALDSRF